MKVPLSRPSLGIQEERAVLEVLRSGWLTQGMKVLEFEREMATYLEIRYARAVNSGSSAIHLALLATGVSASDEVIVPAFTCVAAINPILATGAKPCPVDIRLDTFGIDCAAVHHSLTPRTKAIVIAHLFGLAVDVEELVFMASKHGIPVIEDTALGLGGYVQGRPAGSFGQICCLSFHPRKMITTGEGGMLLTNSDQISARVARLRNYGASLSALERHSTNLFDLPEYPEPGYNYKLTDIQASIGLEQLKKLPHMIQKRREIAGRYDEALADIPWLQLPRQPAGSTHAYQSYVTLLGRKVGKESYGLDHIKALRIRFWQHLAANGIASVQGAQSIAAISYYQGKYGWKETDFPMSFEADLASAALPIYPDLTSEEQDWIIQAVRSFRP